MLPVFEEKSNYPDFLHTGWVVVPNITGKWNSVVPRKLVYVKAAYQNVGKQNALPPSV